MVLLAVGCLQADVIQVSPQEVAFSVSLPSTQGPNVGARADQDALIYISAGTIEVGVNLSFAQNPCAPSDIQCIELIQIQMNIVGVGNIGYATSWLGTSQNGDFMGDDEATFSGLQGGAYEVQLTLMEFYSGDDLTNPPGPLTYNAVIQQTFNGVVGPGDTLLPGTISLTPEPQTYVLCGLGLLGLAWRRIRASQR